MNETELKEELYVEASTLQHTEELQAKIKYKPVGTLYIAYAAAVCLLLTGNLYALVIAATVVAFALFVQFVIKDHETLDIYETYVLVHKLDEEHLVRKVNYADVVEWTCRTKDGAGSAVMFKIDDENIIIKDTFQAPKAHRILDKIMPEKESSEVRRQKERERTKDYKFSLKNIKNIGNIFKKK